MTLSTTPSRIAYSGDGTTTAFPFPYYFLVNADIKVILKDNLTGVETLQVITTDYTIAGAGLDAGGTITMLAAPAITKTLTIYRDPALKQTLDLVENDPLPAESTEKAFDKQTMISQRLSDRLSRSVGLSEGYAASFNPTLPEDLSLAAGAVPLINDDGDGFAPGADWPSASDISGAQDSALAAAASAAAAANSASASSTSADDSQDSADDSAASALAAAASAVVAAAANFCNDVIFITFADSPVTLTGPASRSKLYSCDASGGNIAFTLPAIAGLVVGDPFVIAIKKSEASANTVTINRASTDTINGSTSKTLTNSGDGCFLVPDSGPSPDIWTTLDVGASSSTGVTAKNIKFAMVGGAAIEDEFDGIHVIRSACTLTKVGITQQDSGTSGSSTVRIRYGAALASSVNATITANGGVKFQDNTVSVSLNTNDLVTADLISVADGVPSGLTVDLIFS